MIIDSIQTKPYLFTRLTQMLGLVLMALVVYYLIHIGNKYIDKENRIDLDYKKVGKVVLTLLIAWFLIHIFYTNKVLSEFFVSFVIALFLAYIINPAVAYLEKTHKVPRWAGVLIIYIVIAAILVLMVISIIPRTTAEISKLVVTLPKVLNNLRASVEGFLSNFSDSIGPERVEKLIEALDANIDQVLSRIRPEAMSSVSTAFKNLSQVFAKMINVIMVPIMTFFMVNDAKIIKNKAKQWIPQKYKEDAYLLGGEVNRVMDDFVRGRVIMAVFVGVSTAIVLLIFRIDFAIVIGIVTMIADIIPYIGPFLGFLPAVIFAFMASPLKALWVAIIFLVIQWLENNIVAPKVLSTTVGLHPMVIFVTIIIAGRLFGVLGLILAVPAVAVLQIIVRYAVKKWKEKKRSSNSLNP